MPALETSATRRARLVEYPRIDSELDAVRIDAGDQRLLDSLAAQNCVQERGNCDMEGGLEYVVVKLQRKAQTYVAEARRAAAETVKTLSYLSKNLAGLEGRKTVLMISEGFFTEDVRSELPLIAGQASRAGVTIYTLDARGTSGTGGRTVADASVAVGSLSMVGDTAEEGLDILATDTGGLALRHTDDFAVAMGSVAADTSTYYVLAYSPENTVLDGRYRSIQLKTTWKGLSVRARRGYVATPVPRPKPVRTGGGTKH
jgi:VWFA-related protein